MTAAVPVLTAVTGRWEALLAAGLDRIGGGVVLVRRCADLPELLAAAATGQGRAAVLSADLRSLGGEALSRLELAGVAVVVLVEPDDDGATRRLHQLGVRQVLPVDAPVEDVAAAIMAAVGELASDSSAGPASAGSGARGHPAMGPPGAVPGAGTGAGGARAPEGAGGAGGAEARSGRGAASVEGAGADENDAADSAGPRSARADAREDGASGGMKAGPTAADRAAADRTSADRTAADRTAADRAGEDPTKGRPSAADTTRGRPAAEPTAGDPATKHGVGRGPIGRSRAGRRSASATAYGDPRRSLPTMQPTEPDTKAVPGTGPERTTGRVVAVWGPAGAPGRTTTAVGLAAEVAESGGSCLLVDADTYAGSVAQVLGLLDEAPGLATAARAADHGTLDVRALSPLAPQVNPGLRVLTGLSSPSRWPEVRPASFATVLRVARELTAWTVVDTSASLEQDEELSYDTAAPRRNGVTLQALQDADVVIAVGSADPVGLQRLVRGLQDLAAEGTTSPIVVVNRVRASAVGPGPERAVRRALARYAGVDDPVLVPYDGPALDAAVLQGRTLPEAAPSSPVRAAHLRLAARMGAAPAASGRPVLRGMRRRWLGAGALG